ncbi:hypothetical protein BHM03_00054089 [Ensete ventricosum]|nr:hypothetical protein BHM03_00054089 [Ensete ventricosum]
MRVGASRVSGHTLDVDVVWTALMSIGLHHTLPCFSDGGTERRLVSKSRSELTWGVTLNLTATNVYGVKFQSVYNKWAHVYRVRVRRIKGSTERVKRSRGIESGDVKA